MTLHGMDRQAQPMGNLRIRLPTGNEAQDLELAGREGVAGPLPG